MGGFLVALPRRGEISPELVARVVAESEPRSPDGVGHVVTPDGVLLVQCHFATTPEEVGERLPLVDKTGKVFLVKQGFLANIEQLRARLHDHLGDRVPMHSDAEVMMASYLAWGPAMVERLVGEFVLCIWDGRKKRLFAVRDHLGSHPVLMHTSDEFVLLGSEPRQLLPFPTVSTDMDEYVVADYISGYPQEMRRFFFKDMVRMLPAETVTVDRDGEPQMRQYWRPRVNNTPSNEPPEKFAPMVFELFEEAVRSRMRSATPIACQLSGGLDSSSVLGMAERIRRTDPEKYPALHAYSLLYPGLDCDESEYIQAVLEMWPVPWTGLPGEGVPAIAEIDALRRSVLLPLESLTTATDDQNHWLRHVGVRVVLTGVGGDAAFFSAGLPLPVLMRNGPGLRTAWDCASGSPIVLAREFRRSVVRPYVPRPLLNRYMRAKGSDQLSPVLTARARDLVLTSRPAKLKQPAFQRVAVDTVWNPIVALGSVGGSAVAGRSGFGPRHPFLDRRLLDHIFGLPPTVHAYRGGRRTLQRSALGALMPDIVRGRETKAEFTEVAIRSSAHIAWSEVNADPTGLVSVESLSSSFDPDTGRLATDSGRNLLFEISAVQAVAKWSGVCAEQHQGS